MRAHLALIVAGPFVDAVPLMVDAVPFHVLLLPLVAAVDKHVMAEMRVIEWLRPDHLD